MRITLYRKKDSPWWWCNYVVGGRRHRRSTGVPRTEARRAEAGRVADKLYLKDAARQPKPPGSTITVNEAVARYMLEVTQHHANDSDEEAALTRIADRLGRDRMVHEIADGDITELVARRRGDPRSGKGWKKGEDYGRVGNRTVNADTKLLRAVVNRVALWGFQAGPARAWAKHILPERGERVVEVTEAQEDALWDAVAADRPDMLAMMLFALLSGMRRANVIGLRWSQVDRGAGVIHYMAKSKRPGGEPRRLPLDPDLLAVLQGEEGRHPERVFTFEAQRTAQGKAKGRRYPFTETGWRRAWHRALATAGIPDVHFHDLRHTIATRVLRESGNLRAVQKMLGHARIETTLRYAHVLDEDVRQAMMKGRRAPVRKVAGGGGK